MAKVTHCICHNISFTDLLAARSQGLSTLKDIVVSGAAGCGCELCHPFIEAALEAGNTPVDQ
jgi:NAD(P)H-nitrite reductase large subunit